jgi:hypothetical protein
VAPWPVAFALATPAARLAAAHVVARWFAPGLHVAGAAVCLLQAVYLLSLVPAAGRELLPVRVRRLLLMSVALVVVARFAGGSSVSELGAFPAWAIFDRFAHFAALLFICAVVMREYREQELLVAKTPISEYHRRSVMPERLEGVVLTVDIKRSEWLFRAGARLGDSGKLVGTCLSHLWSAVSDNHGFVLQTEGDQLRAFFPREACQVPAQSALRATDEMQERLGHVARQFREQGVMPDDAVLSFRGGIAEGGIRPIWQDSGGVRVPTWVTSDHSSMNAFNEAERLMALEGQRVDDPRGTHVLLGERLAAQVPDAKSAVSIEKGGVAVYHPRARVAVTSSKKRA